MLSRTPTRTVVVSGGKDPWIQLGVTPDHEYDNIDYIYRAQGLHCPDRNDTEFGREVMVNSVRTSNKSGTGETDGSKPN